MRVYHRVSQRYSSGAWSYPVPTATVTCRTTGGATVQTLTASYDSARHRLYFDTTNSLYASGTLYEAAYAITMAGAAYGTSDWFVACTPATGDVTPPGAPTVGSPSVSDTEASFPLVPPTDSDYAQTVVYATPIGGGTVITGTTATAADTSVSLSGLDPATLYVYTVVAYDTSGNPSVPGGSDMGIFTTHPAATIARPALVKWFINDEDDYSEFGPEEIDPEAGGVQRIPDLGRGREISILIECQQPVECFTLRGIGLWSSVPAMMPGGLRDEQGN